MGYQYRRQVAVTVAYHADSGCCSDVGANIINLRSMHTGSKSGTPSYFLTIRSGYGDRYDVALPDGTLYYGVRRGDPDWALSAYHRALTVFATGLAVCIVLGAGTRFALASL